MSTLTKDDPTLSGAVDALDIVADKQAHSRAIASECTRRLKRLGYSLDGLNGIGTKNDRGWPIHVWPQGLDIAEPGRSVAILRAYALHYAAFPLIDPGLWHHAMRALARRADADIFEAYRNQRIAKKPRQRERGPVWQTIEQLVAEGARNADSILKKISDPGEMEHYGADYPIVVCSESGDDPVQWCLRSEDVTDEDVWKKVAHKRIRDDANAILKARKAKPHPR